LSKEGGSLNSTGSVSLSLSLYLTLTLHCVIGLPFPVSIKDKSNAALEFCTHTQKLSLEQHSHLKHTYDDLKCEAARYALEFLPLNPDP